MVKALLTIKQINLIRKKKFAKTALDKNFRAFVIYITALKTSLKSLKIIIYPSQVA